MKAMRVVAFGLPVMLALLADKGTPAYAWSYPGALNTNAATDSGEDYGCTLTAK
jgi:hypothetical protein